MDDRPAFKIRIAQPADAAEIARLNARFNGALEPSENYAARLVDPHRVDTPILAEIDGHIAGLACLRLLQPVFYPTPYAELTELFVEEDYRRRGLARALVTRAEDLARQGGADELIILTDFYNDAAISLYRALGYQHHDIALSKPLVSTG